MSVIDQLTEREYQISNMVARGATNKKIASALEISEQTVKNHVSAICKKLEVDNRVAIAVAFLRSEAALQTELLTALFFVVAVLSSPGADTAASL